MICKTIELLLNMAGLTLFIALGIPIFILMLLSDKDLRRRFKSEGINILKPGENFWIKTCH